MCICNTLDSTFPFLITSKCGTKIENRGSSFGYLVIFSDEPLDYSACLPDMVRRQSENFQVVKDLTNALLLIIPVFCLVALLEEVIRVCNFSFNLRTVYHVFIACYLRYLTHGFAFAP